MKKKTSEMEPSGLVNPAHADSRVSMPDSDEDRVVRRDQVPELMRSNSNKRILNQRPLNLPTKTLRMKSLLWVKPTVTKSQLSNSLVAQLIPTLMINIAALSAGMSLGYSAIALPQLRTGTDQPARVNVTTFEHVHAGNGPFTVNEEQGSWIASIFGIGAIFGGFASGIFGSRYGRRRCLVSLAAPDILGWILIASAQNVAMMLAGRFFCGFAAAGYAPSIQVFIAEIAQPHHRGWLGAITVPTIGMGTLLSYTLGSLVSWQWVAAVAVLFPAATIVGLVLVVSDSPYWYMQQGQEKKALSVMEKYRSSESNVLAELLAISESLRRPEDLSDPLSLKDVFEQLARRQYRRPFLLLSALFLLMTFSGKHAIGFYAVEIFRRASDGVDEYLSAIITGFIKLIGSFLYLPAIRYFSRRALLCTSALIMGLALTVLGLAVYSHSHISQGSLTHMIGDCYWLPLLCVVVYMLADPLGLGSIPFLYSAEFYPSEMRSFLSGITIGLANMEMFLLVKTFPDMSRFMGGDHGAFWLYAAVCFAAVVFTAFFVPETSGKSLQEIEGFFSHKENLHVTPFVSPSATPASVKRGIAPYPHLSLQFTL